MGCIGCTESFRTELEFDPFGHMKSRKTLASKLNRPGPRRIFLPLVPNCTPVTGAKAYGSK